MWVVWVVLCVCVCAVCAGVAAVMLSARPNASSVEILQRMLAHALPGAINPFSLPEPLRLTTPNLVVALSPSETAQTLCVRVTDTLSHTHTLLQLKRI